MRFIKVRESALLSVCIKKKSVNVYKGDYNTDNTLAKQIFTECPTSVHSFSSSFITSTGKCM